MQFLVKEKDFIDILDEISVFFTKENGLTDIYLVGVGTIGSELLDLISQEGSSSLQTVP